MMLGCVVLLGLVGTTLRASAQTLAHRGWAGSGLNVDPWWQDAVFYEVDPALFAGPHSNAADQFATIVDHLDYLKSLDVDAIVLSPFDLHPEPASAAPAAAAALEATQESFDSLVGEASRRHLRIIVDLPLGQQPAATTLATARFWLGRGVAGLRLTLPKSETAANNSSPADIVRLVGDLRTVCTGYGGDRVLLWDSPQPFSALVDNANQADDEPPPVRVRVRAARATRKTASAAPRKIIAPTDSAPQLAVEDDLARLPALNAMELRATLIGAGITNSRPRELPVFITDAAGRVRSFDRYRSPAPGSEAPPLSSAKLLATALFTTNAVPMLYFGQELGLSSGPQPGQPAGANTMPWGSAPQPATATAAMPPAENPTAANVVAEDQNPNSLLNFYRHLSSLRHANAALREGSFQLLQLEQPGIVAWVRTVRAGGSLRPPVVIVCNLSAQAAAVSLDAELHRIGFTGPGHSSMRTLLVSQAAAAGLSNPLALTSGLTLEPYGVFVGELSSRRGLEQTVVPRKHRVHHHRRKR